MTVNLSKRYVKKQSSQADNLNSGILIIKTKMSNLGLLAFPSCNVAAIVVAKTTTRPLFKTKPTMKILIGHTIACLRATVKAK